MAASKREAGTVGLRLTMPGCPSTWHHLPDQGVWVHPVHPTPCGGPMEPSVEAAKAWAADPAVFVEVVDVPDPDAARFHLEQHMRAVRGLPPMDPPGGGGEAAVFEAQKSTEPLEA